MTQNCPNCNHEFAPDERVCANCGSERPTTLQKFSTRILNQNQGQPQSVEQPAERPEPVMLAPEKVDPAAQWGTGFGYAPEQTTGKPAVDEDKDTEPSLPTFWKCNQCVSLNPSFAEYCETCGAQKPEMAATYVEEKGPSQPANSQVLTGYVQDQPLNASGVKQEEVGPDETTASMQLPPDVMAVLASHDLIAGRGWVLKSGSSSDEGLSRKGGTNEDSMFSVELRRTFETRSEAMGLYIVADGMGGQAAGEVASRMAIESVAPIILSELTGIWMAGGLIEQDYVEQVMLDAISTAHNRLREYNLEEGRDAGTTMTACCIVDGWAMFANVGDSRTYLFRKPKPPAPVRDDITDPAFQVVTTQDIATKAAEEEALRNGTTLKFNMSDRKTAPLQPERQVETQPLQPKLLVERVTHDQSLVQHLVDNGEITLEDVYNDPRRNVILHALGAPDNNLPIDITVKHLEAGDTLLLCSDGLWEMVRDNDIAEQVQADEDMQVCARNLIDLANRNGGADNISVIVVRVDKV
ncbi:MAG TPA: protein phosphatase 2C domain-containing protein [Chloroflexia bacterium]|nr:protein phosphatase 2C domain-containing protein [Chloroflexia bacterium]